MLIIYIVFLLLLLFISFFISFIFFQRCPNCNTKLKPYFYVTKKSVNLPGSEDYIDGKILALKCPKCGFKMTDLTRKFWKKGDN